MMQISVAACGIAVFALAICQVYNLKLIRSLMDRITRLEHK